MLDELEKLWRENPDLRLGQLLVITATAARVTPFYVEDDVLLQTIRKKFESGRL
jgi:hypothetical protein